MDCNNYSSLEYQAFVLACDQAFVLAYDLIYFAKLGELISVSFNDGTWKVQTVHCTHIYILEEE